MKNLLTTKLNDFNEKSLSKSQLKMIMGGDITDPNNDDDRNKKKKNSPTS
jgi:natural product precursor